MKYQGEERQGLFSPIYVPQIPEFSMNRSLPGVVVLATANTGSEMRLATFCRALGRGTPPITPSITGTCPQNARVGSKARIVKMSQFIDTIV